MIKVQIDTANKEEQREKKTWRMERTFNNIYLGSSVGKAKSFTAVEEAHADNLSFSKFRSKTMSCLVDLLGAPDSPVKLFVAPKQLASILRDQDKIIMQYRLIRPTYESLVDW
ncbi:hypothetical protein H0H92_009582 [Tricholoma furcatifolium]|nr:hypothetical protein H0H92_009582 [Tricholoma furcatifolium]